MLAWWMDEPYILAGSCPTYEMLKFYREGGFNVIISLINHDKHPSFYNPEGISHLGYIRHNIPLSERITPTPYQIDHFLKIIKKYDMSDRIIVHCLTGNVRTKAMAVAYWILKGLHPAAARNLIHKNRSKAIKVNEQYLASYSAFSTGGGDQNDRTSVLKKCVEQVTII